MSWRYSSLQWVRPLGRHFFMHKMTEFARAGRSFAYDVPTLFFTAATWSAQSTPTNTSAPEGVGPIRDYIYKSWDTLTGSMEDCSTVVDPKLAENSVLYLPVELATPANIEELQKRCHIQAKKLPEKIERPGQVDTTALTPHGLLYLEHKYVVPGGRFNEMYGWDSYFIVRGLLQDGKTELAKGMARAGVRVCEKRSCNVGARAAHRGGHGAFALLRFRRCSSTREPERRNGSLPQSRRVFFESSRPGSQLFSEKRRCSFRSACGQNLFGANLRCR